MQHGTWSPTAAGQRSGGAAGHMERDCSGARGARRLHSAWSATPTELGRAVGAMTTQGHTGSCFHVPMNDVAVDSLFVFLPSLPSKPTPNRPKPSWCFSTGPCSNGGLQFAHGDMQSKNKEACNKAGWVELKLSPRREGVHCVTLWARTGVQVVGITQKRSTDKDMCTHCPTLTQRQD